MKLAGKIYKGIHYIELQELPQDHQKRLIDSVGKEALIKILVGNAIVRNCVQYKDYEDWYRHMVSAPYQPIESAVVHGPLALEAQLKSIPNT